MNYEWDEQKRMSVTSKILMPTDEGDAQINAGISSDPNSFKFNQQELKRLKSAVKVFPEIVAAYQRGDFKLCKNSMFK